MMVGLWPGLQSLLGCSRVQLDAHSNPANGNESGEYMKKILRPRRGLIFFFDSRIPARFQTDPPLLTVTGNLTSRVPQSNCN